MRILLTGAGGQLGPFVIDRAIGRGHDLVAWTGSTTGRCAGVAFEPVDLTAPGAWEDRVAATRPDAIIHAAAVAAVEAARLDPARARRLNVDATARLAAVADRVGARFVLASTDLVFDGTRPGQVEADAPNPQTTYGRTKVEAERAVLAATRAVVARLSLLYGPTRAPRPSFFDAAVAAVGMGEPRAFFDDEYRTPLDLDSAASILVQLAEGDAPGIVHVGGAERMSRFDLMRRAIGALGLDPTLVRPNRRADAPAAEPRPADVSLDTGRLARLLPGLDRPPVEEAVRRMAGIA